MGAAARQFDFHICPKSEPGPVPHQGLFIPVGSPTVFINGVMAARKGDKALCVGPPATINGGSATVFMDGKAAARKNDTTDHGGTIKDGSANVNIGG